MQTRSNRKGKLTVQVEIGTNVLYKKVLIFNQMTATLALAMHAFISWQQVFEELNCFVFKLPKRHLSLPFVF